jgi:hypothetical protein
VRSLVYLDGHIFLNRLKTIRRDPKRLWIWAVFILLLLFILPQRFVIRGQTGAYWSGISSVLGAAVMFVPGLALLWLGLAVLTSRRAMALFRSAADARFLCGSALPPRVVILWLNFRMLRFVLLQLPAIAFWFVILAPSLRGAIVGILEIWVSFGLFMAFLSGLNLPLIKLRRQIPMLLRATGIVLTGFGLASLAAATSQAGQGSIPAAGVLLNLPPGSWMVGGFHGNPLAIIGLAGCAIAAIALSVRLANDVYPEVWESSLRMITVRRLMRQRGGILSVRETRQAMQEAGVAVAQRRSVRVSSVRGRHVPSGAWTLLWKEWLATVRVRGGLRWPMIGLVLALVIGWSAGGGFGRLPKGAGLALVSFPIYMVLIINIFMSFRLGIDLRNPLWWLSAASLRARLLVLTLARSLRQIVPIAAGLAAAAIAARSATIVFVGLPAFAASVWALQAICMGTYTIIPSPADIRGPGQMLRMFLLVFMIIPLTIVFAVGLVGFRSIPWAVLLTAAGALLEGWGLLAFAAYRLQGNGLAFAQAERR